MGSSAAHRYVVRPPCVRCETSLPLPTPTVPSGTSIATV